MKLPIEKLLSMQKVLDERIEAQHHLQQVNTTEKRMLALQVELGELANETRCFKFWSLKPPAERSVILEEYVDGLHFILSLGLDYGYKPEETGTKENISENLTAGFLAMFKAVSSFHRQPSQKRYSAMFEVYMVLGDNLGFTTEDVLTAYEEKNHKNHDRQDSGY